MPLPSIDARDQLGDRGWLITSWEEVGYELQFGHGGHREMGVDGDLSIPGASLP